MNFLELAKNRYSERFFDSHPMEQEKLDKILEAGRIVPTACKTSLSAFMYFVLRKLLQRQEW
jgi:nitroreductase